MVLVLNLLLAILGEEGLRIGLAAFLVSGLGMDWLSALLIVGFLLGLFHGYYGLYAIPAKILDSLLISLAFYWIGWGGSLLFHGGLNFGLMFRLRLVPSKTK